MITDWSGIGLEYAFTRKNRVVFVDVPKKIMNDEYERIDLEAIEISIRDKMYKINYINCILLERYNLGKTTH